MANRLQFPKLVELLGKLALAGLGLLLLCTVSLIILRNYTENILVQRAALDLPLLKNRWPQFKKSVAGLHEPISKLLANSDKLIVDANIQQLMHEITSAHTYTLAGSYDQGKIIAHVEVVLFEKDKVRPIAWFWSPSVDTGLTNTQLYTRVSLQQLEQTELLNINGLVSEVFSPETIANERRARIFFYLHTEWHYYEAWIKTLIRISQLLSLITVLLIAAWAYFSTNKLTSGLLVILTSIVGLIIYSSFMLKALSLRTILTMLITLQFGASANRASDFAGLSLLLGAAYALLLLGLLHLPSKSVCTSCKRNVKEDYRFCPFCNFALKRNCSRCAKAVDTRWNYCPSCSEEI